jgi:histidyl-tRNA synthetase
MVLYSRPMEKKLPTDPYKGVRDFYPADQFVQSYLFEQMSRACELFGYEEYNASVLEPTDLYRSKTSEEIVNEQTYTFKDRGEREVTLRPEMTPTLARMVAAKSREIPFPARLYSVANFFRYEQVRKGRQREFWQLNADILGASGIEADAEVLALAHGIMRSFGADERNFEIRVSDRRFLDAAYDEVGIEGDLRAETTRLLDKRAKLKDFDAELEKLIGEKAGELTGYLQRTTSTAYLEKLRGMLEALGIGNMIVDTSITRGFDYYTGMVFEVFDASGENERSLFGGGRYDNLTQMFGGDQIPAVGFAVGDVALRDFLTTHNLLPDYTPTTELMLCVVEESAMQHAIKLAQDLRKDDVAVAVNFSGKKIGDQIRQADKMKIPYILAVGEKERNSGQYTIKNLATGHEMTCAADRIAEHLFSSMG